MQKQFDDAHHTWLRSMEFAKSLHESFEDKRLLHRVTANLMLTYSIRKEYSNIEEMLLLVEETFPDNHLALGLASFTRMQIQKDRGDYESAKQHAYRSLEHFERTEDNMQIGHALINVAHFEYLLGNYRASTRSLLSAIKKVVLHEDILVIAVKDYVKSLVKVQENDTALRVIEQYV
ncbi:hypothetical protein [Tumebacillus flagellatus]|uniref:MalT-like TPR region domain-containing protein n=1 Tax=Tumebacillus flagellatus TaxID=1157490 RepID=A0A074LF68_9BACL|nr:hypothetical protein [Tumebacillus flagellatus]KEO80891.1 hypothetical protein EL26_23830 [Tumebacillus flagellatus]